MPKLEFEPRAFQLQNLCSCYYTQHFYMHWVFPVWLHLILTKSLWCTLYCFLWLCMSAQVLSDSLQPMHCSPLGSSVHEIIPARILEWVAVSYSRGSSWPRDQTCVYCISCIGRQILYHWAIREAYCLLFIHREIKVQRLHNLPNST